ncbi:hypothetical protein AAC387_Pa08g2671 [Persea americana]
MDLERPGFCEEEEEGGGGDRKGELFGCGRGSSAICSICLECVVDRGERSIAKLQCGHEFHLDCIGSAFNAKGAMQCPNCRKVEKGQWLYANGYRSLAEFSVDELVNEDNYVDLTYSNLPFGFQWCPFRGFMHLSSLFDEGEPQPNAYQDFLGSAAFGDHSTASSSTHVCPYLSLHGHPRAIHPQSSNSGDLVHDVTPFHRHPSVLGISSSNDVINSQGFSATESRQHNWQQASLPFSVPGTILNSAEQHASQLASRLSRNDSAGQQRLGSFVHPFHITHGSLSRSGSNLVASLTPPTVGDAGSHTRHSGHIYQEPSSSFRNAPFPSIRRARQRGLAFISSVGSNSSVENSGFYGFSVSSGSVNRSHQDGDSIGRRFDRFYGWVREGFAPLPWIPVDGEPWWWSPFHPSQNPQTGSADSISRSYFPHRVNVERVAQGRPENNAHQRLPLPGMSHFM